MRSAGTLSWMVREDDARELAKALYVRDAAGLDTSRNPAAPPPLDPVIEVNAEWQRRFASATAGWNAWWSRLLRTLASAPTERAAFIDAVSSATGGVRDLLDAILPAAEEWGRGRDRAFAARRHDRSYALAINHIVRSVETQLGRRVAPFQLDLLTLPVQGLWSAQAAVASRPDEHTQLQPSPMLLLSRHLRADRAELDRVLRPIVVTLGST